MRREKNVQAKNKCGSKFCLYLHYVRVVTELFQLKIEKNQIISHLLPPSPPPFKTIRHISNDRKSMENRLETRESERGGERALAKIENSSCKWILLIEQTGWRRSANGLNFMHSNNIDSQNNYEINISDRWAIFLVSVNMGYGII